jgi:hypothetical protein
MENEKGRNGESVRIPRDMLAEVDNLAIELASFPGAKPSRNATVRFLVTEGIKAGKAQRGIK